MVTIIFPAQTTETIKDNILYSNIHKLTEGAANMIHDILNNSTSIKKNNNTLNLVAAECIAYPEVKQLLSHDLMDKRIEGLPNKRWYPGSELSDQVENYAIEKVTELFSYKFANVQPYSGSLANVAVYLSLLSLGDNILSLGMKSGGHVSHGSKAHFTNNLYNFYEYGLNEQEEIDYDQVKALTLKHKPKLIMVGASSYYKDFNWNKFREIADLVDALLLADISHISGLIITGKQSTPAGFADILTFDCHKMLRGPRGGVILWNNPNFSKKINLGVSPRLQGAAFGNVIAAKAYSFEVAGLKNYSNYIDNIINNTKILANNLLIKNYKLVSGGTENHMLSFDVSHYGHTGQELANKFEKNGILIQKNQLPSDKENIIKTSGLKVGLSYLTCQNISQESIIKIAEIIDAGIQENWREVVYLRDELLHMINNSNDLFFPRECINF